MKKILSIVLAVAITVILSPVALAATYENYTYEVNSDNTITITGFNNLHLTSINIPETIDGKTVTAIGDNVFKGKASIKEVKIPNSVINIGNYAFYNCHKLTTGTIGNSGKSIGSNCFNLCESLSSIHLNNIETIGEFAFYGCKKMRETFFHESSLMISQTSFFKIASRIRRSASPMSTASTLQPAARL